MNYTRVILHFGVVSLLTSLNINAQTVAQVTEAIDFATLRLNEDVGNVAITILFGFHSCHGSDGCNGCLNIETPPNRGLIDIR